jgi:hypothetical protein
MEYVAAGALDLLLSSILFGLWLSVGTVLLLVIAVFLAVSGLVDLSVGWPRLPHGHGKGLRTR